MKQPLRGESVLVTGGAVRLGRAMALALAEAGADVVVHYSRSTADATRTLEEIETLGVRGGLVQGDFSTDPEAVARRVTEEASKQIGPLSMLINSAAVFESNSLESLSLHSWQQHLDINLSAPTFLSQQFAGQLPTDVAGQIINIVDWRALRPRPGHLAYTIAKSGLVALTKLLAQELAPRIRVNAIAPGAILPPPGEGVEFLEKLVGRIPLRRHGGTADITAALMYLVTSPFVTGEVLTVTGGEEL